MSKPNGVKHETEKQASINPNQLTAEQLTNVVQDLMTRAPQMYGYVFVPIPRAVIREQVLRGGLVYASLMLEKFLDMQLAQAKSGLLDGLLLYGEKLVARQQREMESAAVQQDVEQTQEEAQGDTVDSPEEAGTVDSGETS